MVKDAKTKQTIFYARNDFKRYMEYEEPDYLRVAGLYNSCEQSRRAKTFNHVLVKKADYVAEKLGWIDAFGNPDTKRAQNAINRALSTKGANGMFYLYSVSNKNHCVTKSGGSRVYMSAPRWQEYQYGLSLEKTAQMSNNSCESLDEFVTKAKEVLSHWRIVMYDDDTLLLQVKRLLSKQDPVIIDQYFDCLLSDWYGYQLAHRAECPRIRTVYDLFNRFDAVRSFYHDWDRQYVPSRDLTR